jgi:hypothetical protein
VDPLLAQILAALIDTETLADLDLAAIKSARHERIECSRKSE